MTTVNVKIATAHHINKHNINTMEKEISHQAMDVIRDNAPQFFKQNAWKIISICIDNEDWSKRIVDQAEQDLLFMADITHDILGLLNKDEHFVPRI